jgi:putative MATE family efflux protein
LTKRIQNFRPIWHLAWPAILELLFQSCVSYVDTAMVGRLGAEASASVGLTTSVIWLLSCVLTAMGVGCVAYISRTMGAGEGEKAHCASLQSIWLALLLGGFLTVVTVLIHKPLPGWMNAERSITQQAGQYFLIVTLPMIFRAAVVLFGSVLRGAGDTRTPMIYNIIMNLVNIALNLLLIYPTRTVVLAGVSLILPGAGLGVNGAGIATALSFVVGGLMMFRAMWKNPLVTPAGQRVRWDTGVLRSICQVGVPVMVQRVVCCIGYIAFAALVACLGTIPLAANSIATSAEDMFYVAGYGVQAAAITLAGNALGAKDPQKFRQVVRYSVGLTVVLLAVSGAILFVGATPLMRVFSTDEEVVALGAAVLKMVALSEPIFGIMVVLEGAFNGIGDTRAPVIYSLASMWGIRIFCTAICVLVFKTGLRAVWCCMIGDNVLKAILLSRRYLVGKWIKRFPVDS